MGKTTDAARMVVDMLDSVLRGPQNFQEPIIRVWIGDEADAPGGCETHRCPGGLFYYDVDPQSIADHEPGSFVHMEAFDRANEATEHPYGMMAVKGNEPADGKEWVPYEGPQGGEGWRSTVTQSVRYTDEPPKSAESVDIDEITPEDVADVQISQIPMWEKPAADEVDIGRPVEINTDRFGMVRGEITDVGGDSVSVLDETGREREFPIRDGEVDGDVFIEKTSTYASGVAAVEHPLIPDEGEPTEPQIAAEALRRAASIDDFYETGPMREFVDDMRDRGIDDHFLEAVVEAAVAENPALQDHEFDEIMAGGAGTVETTGDQRATAKNAATENEDIDESMPSHHLSESKSWVPYEGPRGGSGWKNLKTDEVIYSDEPPGETIDPKKPSPNDPMTEGDRVLLRYDGEVHHGEVIAESDDPLNSIDEALELLAMYEGDDIYDDMGRLPEVTWEAGELAIQNMPEFSGPPPEVDSREELAEEMVMATNPSVRIKDDRNIWTFGAGESERYDGDMEVLNLGEPESDYIEPESVEPESVEEAEYVLSELYPEEAAPKLIDAISDGSLSEDDVVDAIRSSGASFGLLGTEMMEHAASDVGGLSVGIETTETNEGEWRSRFEDRYGEEQRKHLDRIAVGWEQAMYADKKAAPMIQTAMRNTGNDTMPEYNNSDIAAAASVGEEAMEAAQNMSDFTTEALRKAFGDEITVFRGFSKNPHQGTRSEGTDAPDALRAAKEGNEDVKIEHRPVESWTLTPKTARMYAGGDGAVVETTVSVEDVFASSSVGTIDPWEDDTVVEHDGPQTYSPDNIHTGDELKDDENIFKLRMKAAVGAQR